MLASMVSDSMTKKESKKPKYSRFTQQELPAWKPLLTPEWVIGGLFVIGILFIPIGIICLFASNGVVEISKRYDDICIPEASSNQQRDSVIRDYSVKKSCTFSLKVEKEMKLPIYVYYQLDNFYQNHRRYVKSRSDSQLQGKSGASLDTCKPRAYEGGDTATPILPCGLIAWSSFNDTFSFSLDSGLMLTVNETEISWKSDRDVKFSSKVFPKNFNLNETDRGGLVLPDYKPLNEDEHLIVWMRTAALPSFRKLWGRIDIKENFGFEPKPGDTILIDMQNLYNTYAFDGKKHIVLSTASWLGGKNPFLGYAYLIVGGICIVLAVIFFFLQMVFPRPLGDVSYLSWNKKAMAAAAAAGAST